MNVKILAMYLPQFHSIPENDLFWGKGFTDWVGVINSKPLFEGHVQPKIPINGYYYDLSKKEDIKHQVDLANKYGIYGFGIYHYWFNSDKVLLTKPAEIILNNKDLNINFFFAWDNISWKRSWSKIKGNDWAPISDPKKENKNSQSLLIEYILGSKKDWEKHFNYLLPYFKDSRYIKINNCPLFSIFHYSSDIITMCEYWNELAIKNGFNGIHILYRNDPFCAIKKNMFTFNYEPATAAWGNSFNRAYNKLLNLLGKNTGLKKYDYDKVWKKILKTAQKRKNENMWHGAFVNYDDTPRRGNKGKVIINGSPEKFKTYMTQLINICEKQNKEYILFTAWNEWGEGAFLEPDEKDKYTYLEKIHDIIKNNSNQIG